MLTWNIIRIIPLDVTGVDRSATPDSVIEYSCFQLSTRNTDDIDGPRLGYYSPKAFPFTSLVLRHRYCSSQGHLSESDFWYTFAGPRLERLTLMELYMIPVPQRPARIQEQIDATGIEDDYVRFYGLGSAMEHSDIELPSYDSEIPKWYAEWERQQQDSPIETRSDNVQMSDAE